jgi:hypothetical protein
MAKARLVRKAIEKAGWEYHDTVEALRRLL